MTARKPEKLNEEKFSVLVPAHIIRARERGETQTITPDEGFMLDEKLRRYGYNQSHAEWTAYTDELLKPLEETIERNRDEVDLSVVAISFYEAIKTVIENHRRE